MTNIKIVTDSSITIEKELVEKYDITIVPLSVMVDGQVYSDSDLKEEGKFLRMLQESKELPKTSQPPIGLFVETFDRLADEGAQKIVAIHMTHSLSGTVEAARQASMLSQADVTVIDSTFTDQCLAFQVIAAAKLAQSGADLETIIQEVETVRKQSALFIGVSTLENLVKGGRIGRVTGLLTSLLNIKVIMTLENHTLIPIVKGRGQKTFTKWLDQLIADTKTKPLAEIGISYAGSREMADQFRERLSDLQVPITVLETGSIIQTHTGEGAFAVMLRYDEA